eukprot:1139951-Pelagomonas_calceolata.AAC.3
MGKAKLFLGQGRRLNGLCSFGNAGKQAYECPQINFWLKGQKKHKGESSRPHPHPHYSPLVTTKLLLKGIKWKTWLNFSKAASFSSCIQNIHTMDSMIETEGNQQDHTRLSTKTMLLQDHTRLCTKAMLLQDQTKHSSTSSNAGMHRNAKLGNLQKEGFSKKQHGASLNAWTPRSLVWAADKWGATAYKLELPLMGNTGCFVYSPFLFLFQRSLAGLMRAFVLTLCVLDAHAFRLKLVDNLHLTSSSNTSAYTPTGCPPDSTFIHTPHFLWLLSTVPTDSCWCETKAIQACMPWFCCLV